MGHLLHQAPVGQQLVFEGVQLGGHLQVLDLGNDLGQDLQGLIGIPPVLLQVLIGAVQQVVLFVAPNFQDDFPQVVGNLDHVLLKFDGVQIMIGKPADEADGQDAGGEAQDDLLAYVQVHGNSPFRTPWPAAGPRRSRG